MKNIAVIFAGGTGQRMGSDIPKQFLKIHGKEIIIHTLEVFNECNEIDEIYIACIKEWIDYLKKLVEKYTITKVKNIVAGGNSGQESIFIGLTEVKKNNENAIVLIHDGVRPLIDNKTISNCINSVKKYGSAITVSSCFETPIISNDGKKVDNMPERKKVFVAKAPQCFYLDDIYKTHLKERKINPNYTDIVDSCGLMFKNNFDCHLIEGNRNNIKVTTSEDYCTLIGNYITEDYKQFLATQK